MEDTRAKIFGEWIGTDRNLLDLGGRDGTLTRYFLNGNRVTLADVDRSALSYAAEHYAVETYEVDLNTRLPFEDESYDVVMMAEVLEHLPYPSLSLTEVQRVLRPGGQFIGSIPLAYHLKDRWQVLRGHKLWMAIDPTHLQFFSYDELRELLSRYFRVEDVRVLKGGKKAERWPQWFARDVAFRCTKV